MCVVKGGGTYSRQFLHRSLKIVLAPYIWRTLSFTIYFQIWSCVCACMCQCEYLCQLSIMVSNNWRREILSSNINTAGIPMLDFFQALPGWDDSYSIAPFLWFLCYELLDFKKAGRRCSSFKLEPVDARHSLATDTVRQNLQ